MAIDNVHTFFGIRVEGLKSKCLYTNFHLLPLAPCPISVGGG